MIFHRLFSIREESNDYSDLHRHTSALLWYLQLALLFSPVTDSTLRQASAEISAEKQKAVPESFYPWTGGKDRQEMGLGMGKLGYIKRHTDL